MIYQIAIQGNKRKGQEIIKILESLGGTNKFEWLGDFDEAYYFISEDGLIDYVFEGSNFIKHHDKFTIDEWLTRFPFKVGDGVRKYINKEPRGYYTIATITNFDPYSDKPYCVFNSGGMEWCYSSQLKLIKNNIDKHMEEKRNITITIEKAKQWYKIGGELKEIALQAFTEQELNNELPESWEHFCKLFPTIGGEAYITLNAKVQVTNSTTDRDPINDRNLLPSAEIAEQYLTLMKLHQLRDAYRNHFQNGWTPNWTNDEYKYCVMFSGATNNLTVVTFTRSPKFLSFPNRELAELFLERFKKDIDFVKFMI